MDHSPAESRFHSSDFGTRIIRHLQFGPPVYAHHERGPGTRLVVRRDSLDQPVASIEVFHHECHVASVLEFPDLVADLNHWMAHGLDPIQRHADSTGKNLEHLLKQITVRQYSCLGVEKMSRTERSIHAAFSIS